MGNAPFSVVLGSDGQTPPHKRDRHAMIIFQLHHLLRVALVCCLALTGSVTGAALHADPASFLQKAWMDAAPGARIVLPAGDYGAVKLDGGGGAPGRPVTLVSATPYNPARMSELVVRGVSHLVLDGLVLDYTFAPADELRARPFVIEGSTHIVLRNALIDGDAAHDMDAASNGLPAGFGLTIERSNGVTVENTRITGFWRGLSIRNSQNLRILGNDLYGLRMDGMNFAQVTDVLIANNTIRDFKRSTDKRDHADMIQFWTAHTTAPSRNITIRGNLMKSGSGMFTQTIFMGNTLVDKGKAGEEMYFRNVTIEDNLIINAHKHGIAVGASLGVQIANNTLVHNPASDGDRNIVALYRPQISVSPLSRDVVVENNVAADFKLPEGQSGWQVSGNLKAQDTGRMKPNHYSVLFAGMEPADPTSFRPKPGGPLDGTGIGVQNWSWP